MEEDQQRANAAPAFVVSGIVGLVLGGIIVLNSPFGWVFLGLGGSLFNAGLIGIAVNGYKSRPAPTSKPAQGEYPNPLRALPKKK